MKKKKINYHEYIKSLEWNQLRLKKLEEFLITDKSYSKK